jgi:hypothetical protein
VELLLGLRDPRIDAQLRALAPLLNDEGDNDWSMGRRVLSEALDQQTVQRVVGLASRTASALSMA